jgi:hypothetical protein
MLLIAATTKLSEDMAKFKIGIRTDIDYSKTISYVDGPDETAIIIGPDSNDGLIQFLDKGRIIYYKHRADKYGLNTARSAWEIQEITADYMDAIMLFYKVSNKKLELNILPTGHVTLWDNTAWGDDNE